MSKLPPSPTSNPAAKEEKRLPMKQTSSSALKFTKISRVWSQQLAQSSTLKTQPKISQIDESQIRPHSEPALSVEITTRKGLKTQTWKNKSRIKLNREEQLILGLDPSLQKLRKERSLHEKSVQIKYVNTLKKIKATSSQLGCKVKVQSSGFTLQNTKEKQTKHQEAFHYNFSKQFNRYFRRKLVQKLTGCEATSRSLQLAMNKEVEQMEDTVKLNKKSQQYQQFTSHRMQTYLTGVSTQKKKMPFSVKKQLDSTFQAIELMKEQPIPASRKISEMEEAYLYEGSPCESPTAKGSKNSTSTKWSLLLTEYSQDIQQFEEICDFFKRIQHELLRYMPNNHLSNKINNIISQVEHSNAIRKIYDQCNVDISLLVPTKIVQYLRKNEGILSSMNYIVNVIKLNISAERRKRFLDLEKVIGKYQQLTATSVRDIADKLKKIDNPQIKKNINEAIQKTDISCRGMDSSYLSFVRQAEEQEFSSINSSKNRNIICEILKFQSLMK